MYTTVVVAALGVAGTLFAPLVTARLQRRASLEARVLDARLRTYGECVANLYEYERATFNRVQTRLRGSLPEGDREVVRQSAYRQKAQVRSLIAQVAVVTSRPELAAELAQVLEGIDEFNSVETGGELGRRHDEALERLDKTTSLARSELYG